MRISFLLCSELFLYSKCQYESDDQDFTWVFSPEILDSITFGVKKCIFFNVICRVVAMLYFHYCLLQNVLYFLYAIGPYLVIKIFFSTLFFVSILLNSWLRIQFNYNHDNSILSLCFLYSFIVPQLFFPLGPNKNICVVPVTLPTQLSCLWNILVHGIQWISPSCFFLSKW